MNLLLADDEILTLNMLEKIIDWDALGIKIIGKAKNGFEALEILKNNPIDLLISDIKMPIMDGLELLKNIRNLQYDVKVVLLSAYSEFEYAQRAIEYGVSGYLLKPIDEGKLLTLVSSLINLPISWDLLSYAKNNYSHSIIKAITYIHQNYEKELSLDEISEAGLMSKNYFCNLFKKETKETIVDYITKVRIQNAKLLLRDSNLKIYEISYKVGYANPTYFNKIFKKVTGVTPFEFRS